MSYETLILIFTSIIWEAMPFIVLGVVLAGVLEEFVPQQAITKVIPKNKILAIAMGGVLGLVFPMCECGAIVVVMRPAAPQGPAAARRLRRAASSRDSDRQRRRHAQHPTSPSTPPASSTPSRRSSTTPPSSSAARSTSSCCRCGLGFLVAFNVGLIVDRLEGRLGVANLVAPNVLRGLTSKLELIDEDTGPKDWMSRHRRISGTALNDFVDIMAFLVIGAVLASAGRLWIQNSNIETWFQDSPALSILIMMALAIAFCICSEADAFIAANFPMYWPPAAKLAFLVLGPMLDFKLILMYTRVFRAKLIYTITISVCIQVFVFAMAVHYVPLLAGYKLAQTGSVQTPNVPISEKR